MIDDSFFQKTQGRQLKRPASDERENGTRTSHEPLLYKFSTSITRASYVKNYYENNHQEYFNSTVNLEPSSFLNPLAERLQLGSTILDIGCGSGRDLLWLARRAFKPTGFEQSPGLAALARNHSHCPVIEGDFTIFDFSGLQYDALLMVGAFVHLEKEVLAKTLKKTAMALKKQGYIYLSLKSGKGKSRIEGGRTFVLWSADELYSIFGAAGFHP